MRFPTLRALALAVLAALSSVVPAQAATGTDAADVARAESYLNQITTLRARFLQVAPSGDTVEGTIYLSRPGKLRLEYDPPSPILVVADGSFLIYIDKKLGQTSYIGLESSPAGILIRPQVRLDGAGLKVARVSRAPGVLNVTVVAPDKPEQGQITLVFTESPFMLKQWRVLDAQGQVTQVSLFDAKTDLALKGDLFEYKDPRFLPGAIDSSTQDR